MGRYWQFGILCICAVGIGVACQGAPPRLAEKGSPESGVGGTRQTSLSRGRRQKNAAREAAVGDPLRSPEQESGGKRRPQHPDYEARLSWFTEMLVGVGVLQFLVLGVQACVFWRTLHQMRDTSQRQLRAYICVTRSHAKIGERIEGEVHIKNFGQTPAYDVRQWMSVWVEAHPLGVVLPEPEPTFRMARAVLGPGDPLIMRARQNLPAPGANLGTPEATIYVYGRVLYRDAFGEQRQTSYRLIFGGPEAVSPEIARTEQNFTVLLKPDLEGNEAD